MIDTKKTVLKTRFTLETKSTTEGFFKGYASIFDEVDSHNDRVVRGAFEKSLHRSGTERDFPKMLWQHSEQDVIGVWQKVHEDAKGLYVEGKLLTDIPKGREALALIQEGALDGLSIGYCVKEALCGRDKGAVRLLTEVDLLEISLVTFPANSRARISI